MHGIGSTIGRIWSAMLKAASVRQWAMIGGAFPMTFTVWWIIGIVKDKMWGQSVLQINALANIAYGSLLLVALIFVALTGTSIAANVGKGGANISLKSDDDDDPRQDTGGVVVTTKEDK